MQRPEYLFETQRQTAQHVPWTSPSGVKQRTRPCSATLLRKGTDEAEEILGASPGGQHQLAKEQAGEGRRREWICSCQRKRGKCGWKQIGQPKKLLGPRFRLCVREPPDGRSQNQGLQTGGQKDVGGLCQKTFRRARPSLAGSGDALRRTKDPQSARWNHLRGGCYLAQVKSPCSHSRRGGLFPRSAQWNAGSVAGAGKPLVTRTPLVVTVLFLNRFPI